LATLTTAKRWPVDPANDYESCTYAHVPMPWVISSPDLPGEIAITL
jgi:hypothetical protein